MANQVCVKLVKSVRGLQEARDWEMTLPDEWFSTKEYNFDGHGITVEKSPKYDLFWFPKSLKTAMRLFEAMEGNLSSDSMRDVQVILKTYKVN